MNRQVLTKYTKTALYAFSGAFILSLLVGLMTHNPFGIVLMRALLSAPLFGALVYAGVWVLRQYIPELASEAGRGTKKGGGSADTGTKFDFSRKHEVSTPEAESVNTNEKAEWTDRIVEESGRADSVAGDVEIEGEPDTELSEGDASKKDALPSLDGLFTEEGETIPDFEEEPRKKSDSRLKGDQITLGKFQIPIDPEILAKAIKKVMREDEGR